MKRKVVISLFAMFLTVPVCIPASAEEAIEQASIVADAEVEIDALTEGETSGQCGSFAYWEMRSDGTLRITGEGDMNDYSWEGNMAIYNVNKDDIAVRVLGKIAKGPQGIETGYKRIDEITGGLMGGQLYVIGSRPAMGKTALALNIAEHLAIKQDKKVIFYSLEMSAEKLVERLLQIEAKITTEEFKNPDDNAFTCLYESVYRICVCKSNLVIDDTICVDFEDKFKNRDKNELKDADVIIVDYLQLITTSHNADFQTRREEVEHIIRLLKYIASELDIPVIVLSQCSRAVEQRPDHRPILSDLRETGIIEECADVVMFLYRDEYYNRDSEYDGIAEIIIAKNNSGYTGFASLAFIREYLIFANIEDANV